MCVCFIYVKCLEVWRSVIHSRISVEGTANTRLEILNQWDCMYAWNNKREGNRICFAVVWFGPPLFPLLASKGKHVPALWVRENERGSHCGCISCGGKGGRTQIKWQQERFGIFLYYIFSLGCHVFCVPQRWLCTVHLYWRRGGQRNEAESWRVDLDWRPDQLSCRIVAQ